MGAWQNSSNLCGMAAVPKNSTIFDDAYKVKAYNSLLPSTYYDAASGRIFDYKKSRDISSDSSAWYQISDVHLYLQSTHVTTFDAKVQNSQLESRFL